MSSRMSNSIKNIFSGLGLKILLLLLQFATKTVFVKYLGDFLGLNSLITSVISYLNITELGISTAINFAMYKPIAECNQEKVKQYLAYYSRIYRILGLVVLAIGAVLAPFLPFMLNIDDLTVGYKEVYFIYVLNVINSVYPYYVYANRGGFLNASQKEYKLTFINYSTTILTVVFQLLTIVVLQGSFVSFALYTSIPIVLSILRSWLNGIFAAKWYPYIKEKPSGKLSPNEKKELYKNTYGIAISKICTIVNNSIDSIIISAFIGINTLGKYSLYNTLIGMVTSFVSILFTSIQPSIGNLNAEADVSAKKQIFNLINFIAFWVYGFTSVCYFTLVQPFMEIWAGKERVMPIIIPLVVVMNYLTSGLSSAVNVFREGCGLYYQGRYRPIASTAVNVLSSLFLVYYLTNQFDGVFGVVGVVLATIISRMSITWWYDAYIVYKNLFGERPYRYLSSYLYRLVFVLLAGGVCYNIGSILKFNTWINFVLMILICFIIFNSLFVLIFRNDPAYQRFINILKRSIVLVAKRFQ